MKTRIYAALAIKRLNVSDIWATLTQHLADVYVLAPYSANQANMRRWPNVGLLLAHHGTLAQCWLTVGSPSTTLTQQ